MGQTLGSTPNKFCVYYNISNAQSGFSICDLCFFFRTLGLIDPKKEQEAKLKKVPKRRPKPEKPK